MHPWLALASAQARLPLGLAAAYDGPLLGKAARALSGTVREEESVVGGVPAVVYRRGRGRGPWPAVVLFPGVTRRGRRHPALRAIGRGLGAAGHLAIVPEPEGLAVGELTPSTASQARAAVAGAMTRPDALDGRAALVGVSGGGTLALLSAADPRLAERVSIVVALAPVCDISEAIRVVTTGAYRDAGRLVPFSTGDFYKLVIARSVVAWLEPGEDRKVLGSHLLSREDYGPEPLSGLRAWPRDGLGAAARAVVALLSNQDPERFEELLAGLPEEIRAHLDSLSAVSVAGRISAPVELVVAREDKYIQLADSASFTQACPTATSTVLASLTHVVPSLSLAAAGDLARLDGILVRLLAASYSRR